MLRPTKLKIRYITDRNDITIEDKHRKNKINDS